ncbi:29bbe129-e0a8-4db1-ba73-917cc67d0381 [Thermothielavioides terrestris]|uniref:29bbe129-e0a8-4db1-ba73-917cc67d0381 n=1 Tax=Thermothielavioides terrestris TaxID=2587410 RepID=A0A446BEX8_9PEZI|nr:29bbe129-e0a8-4db1-ba73-917cc67d0381 [Thermothielavioides terrestris]
MQRLATTPTQGVPFLSFFGGVAGGGGGASTSSNTDPSAQAQQRNAPSSPTSKQQPTSADEEASNINANVNPSGDSGSPRQQRVLHKDRKPSFGRRPSFFTSSPAKRNRRRADSAASNTGPPPDGYGYQPLDSSPVPALPDPSPKTTADGFSKMMSRGAVTPVSGYPVGMAVPASMLSNPSPHPQSELSIVYQQIQETANKRISTFEYLRKAHEGRIYWFNTLLFDKADLQRMPYFDARKLGRRATNYLLLGISLPAVVDLNSGSALEFLRSLNALLAEFDAFQQIHTENGIAASSLTRTRIPQMFRRAAAPVSKGRRSSSAAGRDGDIGYSLEQVDSNHLPAASTTTSATTMASSLTAAGSATNPSSLGSSTAVPPTATSTTITATAAAVAPTAAGDAGPPAGVMAFGASEVDLLPGEEYAYLLTPTLPFEPDFFETFATLCDVLADTYARLLGLVPTPRECGGAVGELFTKADAKIKKLFIQPVVREFEDAGRAGVKAEVANVGRVVLSGLM